MFNDKIEFHPVNFLMSYNVAEYGIIFIKKDISLEEIMRAYAEFLHNTKIETKFINLADEPDTLFINNWHVVILTNVNTPTITAYEPNNTIADIYQNTSKDLIEKYKYLECGESVFNGLPLDDGTDVLRHALNLKEIDPLLWFKNNLTHVMPDNQKPSKPEPSNLEPSKPKPSKLEKNQLKGINKNLPFNERVNNLLKPINVTAKESVDLDKVVKDLNSHFKHNSTDLAKEFLKKAKIIKNTSYSNEDGIDHINIARDANTELGKLLDINSYSPFNHPSLGNFNSLGGFWLYITAEAESTKEINFCRWIHGSSVVYRKKGMKTKKIDGFVLIMADALWYKINAIPELVEAMVINKLPYSSYFATKEKQTLSKIGAWYVPVLNEITRTLREIKKSGNHKLMPDFKWLINLKD